MTSALQFATLIGCYVSVWRRKGRRVEKKNLQADTRRVAELEFKTKRFGRLVPLEPVERSRKLIGGTWRFRCDCGTEIVKPSSYVTSLGVRSCGCLRREGGPVKFQPKDLTGRQFGRLTALRTTGKRKSGERLWQCRCSCGRLCTVGSGALGGKRRTDCGCRARATRLSRRRKGRVNVGQGLKDRTGQRFGQLVCEAYAGRKDGKTMWRVRCDCGNTAVAAIEHMRAGSKTSCGCAPKGRKPNVGRIAG